MKFVPEIQFLKRNVISHVGQIDELLEIVHEKSKKTIKQINMYFGFLNINKPVAMVSTKITNYTKYALRITVGHIGTYLHLEYYLLQLARQHS